MNPETEQPPEGQQQQQQQHLHDAPLLQGCPYLTDQQIEAIAERAAVKAANKVLEGAYIHLGRSMLKVGGYSVGIGILVLAAWLFKGGYF